MKLIRSQAPEGFSHSMTHSPEFDGDGKQQLRATNQILRNTTPMLATHPAIPGAPSVFAVASPSQKRGDRRRRRQGAAPFVEPELSSNCATLRLALRGTLRRPKTRKLEPSRKETLRPGRIVQPDDFRRHVEPGRLRNWNSAESAYQTTLGAALGRQDPGVIGGRVGQIIGRPSCRAGCRERGGRRE